MARVVVQNLIVEDNVFTENANSFQSPISISGLELECDSLFFRRNTSTSELSVGRIKSELTGAGSVVRHMVLENNISGGVYGGAATENGRHLEVQNVSLEDCIFIGNESHLAENPADPGENVLARGGLVHFYSSVSGTPPGDSLYIRNCQFIDNYMNDHNDYDYPGISQTANYGRALFIDLNDYQYLELSDCIFTGNRQPNVARDVTFESIGNLVFAIDYGVQPPEEEPRTMVVKNCVFDTNDEGGLHLQWMEHVRLENVQIRNSTRKGVWISTRSAEIHNVWVDSLVAIEPAWQHSTQVPFLLYNTDLDRPSRVSNLSITNCVSPYVITGNYEDESFPQSRVLNSLFWNNSFQLFEGTPIWPEEPRPIRFEHCLVPGTVQDGANNLEGLNPLFDGELGAPWLSPASPCIDAGDPDPVYNDREDLAQPGFAQWPSQGGLRNDIGFSGGPGAGTLEHLVGIDGPSPEVPEVPSGIRLEPPFPNPFNPSTRIRIELQKPERASLRVYNLRGQRVRTLVDQPLVAGMHEYTLHAPGLASGVYIVRLETAGQARTRKLLLLK